eukprot:Skav212283  [mRNA]  locus=scaffold732:376965:378569:- [translate_table: standard]
MHLKEFWFQQLQNQLPKTCRKLDCMLNLPAEELLSAFVAIPKGMAMSGQDLFAHLFVPWAPAIDGVEITAPPLELLKQANKINKVPTVIGLTLDDGARFFDGAYNLSAKDFRIMFQDKYGATRAQAKLYTSESHPSLQGYEAGWWSAERAITDQIFFCPAVFAARSLARAVPVFSYVFAASTNGPIATHSVDLPFVWMDLPHASAEEKQLASDVVMSWSRFATSSDPGAWPKMSSQAAPMMKFQVASDGGNRVIDGSYRDRQCAFMMDWISQRISIDPITSDAAKLSAPDLIGRGAKQRPGSTGLRRGPPRQRPTPRCFQGDGQLQRDKKVSCWGAGLVLDEGH